jgi:wyosine [tRNA(Phe)-imidazoG37] synthetase (radical SAM superfamily)
MSVVYGPVPSWRLGRSLGIDPVSTQYKTCSFDCLYCQLGRTKHPLSQRKTFVDPQVLGSELKQAKEIELDYVTFSGMAEPTLAANLPELVAVVRENLPGRPIAILTNSSLMPRPDLRDDLSLFDVVVAKIDAPNQDLFARINRPFVSYTLDEILEGIRHFREEFAAKLALQMMFIEANRPAAHDMAEIARDIRPDEVQLNTPLRPCQVPPLSPAQMKGIEAAFEGLEVINVYTSERPQVTPVDIAETRRRRPEQQQPEGLEMG